MNQINYATKVQALMGLSMDRNRNLLHPGLTLIFSKSRVNPLTFNE